LFLGNLSSQRDWGHAKDYIRAMYLILQQDQPDDYVIATGITTTIRNFVKSAAAEIGLEITFTGEGVNEKGYLTSIDKKMFIKKAGEEYLERIKSRITTTLSSPNEKDIIIAIDPAYFRPTEVDLLIGDSSKARAKLGWEPKYNLQALIADMITSDINLIKKDRYLNDGGYRTLNYFE
jgi:GDPmannose 4,6-dehydratase